MSARTIFRGLVLMVVLCTLWAGEVCAQGALDAGGDPAALTQAADRGDAKAQFKLGEMYTQGQGVPQDYAKAAILFQKSAAQGFVPAQGFLGVLYVHGVGVPKDVRKGCGLLHTAMAKGTLGMQKVFDRYCVQ